MIFDVQYRLVRGRKQLFIWLVTSPPPKKVILLLTGLGLHLLLKAQFPISTNYGSTYAKVDLSILSQMVLSNLEYDTMAKSRKE